MREHPILVGYDGSAASTAALRWALGEAERRSLGVRVVRVLDIPRRANPTPASRATEAHMFDEAEVALDQIAATATAGLRRAVPLTTAALAGPVVDALCEQSRQASLTVLGSRGVGGLAGLLLGSVSVAVAAHAHSPVAVVREHMSAAPGRPVLVGVDGSDVAGLALEFAFAEAAARGVRLRAVHAVPGEGAEPAGQQLLTRALEPYRRRYPQVTVVERVVPGTPGPLLATASLDAQLVVVGSRGRGGFHGLLLGSVSQQVLHRAGCPVAVVRRYATPAPRTTLRATTGTVGSPERTR
ncbi:MAG TPA: universal stress protein [Rugosimonospora sp.]|nr:universal stress protein [Rugosimonospora sp.]